MKVCDWCGEPLVAGDTYIVPCIGGEKKYVRYHSECHMRQFLGSLAHIEGRCSCHVPGATETDPEGMTLRQAARAAVEAWEKKLGARFLRPPWAT